MAEATRLLLLSIIIPDVMMTTMAGGVMVVAAAGLEHQDHVRICTGGGGDVEAAGQLMPTLTHDLFNKVPSKGREYCNVLTWKGLEMYGYASCGSSVAASACGDCLRFAGGLLIGGCQRTGSGKVIVMPDVCFVWIGFRGCPDV